MKKYTILLIFALASIAAPAQCPVTNTAFKSGDLLFNSITGRIAKARVEEGCSL